MESERWSEAEGDWDWRQMSRSFLDRAAAAQRRLWEIQDEGIEAADRQAVYDRTLAEFSLYQQLWGRPFLRSREGLLEELENLTVTLIGEDKTFDRSRFFTARRRLIAALLERYGS